jgi:hypothetical protein
MGADYQCEWSRRAFDWAGIGVRIAGEVGQTRW